jgi:acetyl esterase/lipase
MSIATHRLRKFVAAMTISMALPVLAAAQNPTAPPGPRLLGARDLDTMALTHQALRIAYGADSLQYGELRLPPTGSERVPLVVVIHGGCFQANIASARNSAALADAMPSIGVASWNVEYRSGDRPGGGWPGTLQDIADAVDHARVLARLHPIDTSRIVVVGHSAGGFFAVWSASRRGIASRSPFARGVPVPLAGVVSIGGFTDLAEFRNTNTGCSRGVDSLLGNLPERVPERYVDADPMPRLPFGVPSVHIAGDRDPIGTLARREAFAAAARRAGDRASVITVDGGHFEVMAPATLQGRVTIDAIRELLALPPTGR